MNSDIDQSVGEIMEELDKCKESAGLKTKILEEEKERFQKAAIAVLEMLNGSEVMLFLCMLQTCLKYRVW